MRRRFEIALTALSFFAVVASFVLSNKVSAAPCTILIAIHEDQSFELNGASYAANPTDRARFRKALVPLVHGRSGCRIKIATYPQTSFKPIGEVILALQQAGVAKVGFLIEPRRTP